MPNQIVVATYRVKPECEHEFQMLLSKHWPTLRALGFVSDEPPIILRSVDDPPTYTEIFTWVENGFEMAHEHPDVLAIWEPMDPLLESRQGLPRWDFPHYLPWSAHDHQ
ncbi:hypothetical protein [Sulfobacillus harzensis]|uniref:Uncharacterized protein n=1 Tax=Sulfobacillus harzensis TaxID=2729629 RepID=A0A7Y0L2B5_9FIRM|nr:hypothetical protein [Sulfobacillus harzensis]NMP21431.1 hypothetical protein [Sulfobacillus harzensis]